MKVLVVFAAVCIFALVLRQTAAETEETAAHVVRRGGKGETSITELRPQLFSLSRIRLVEIQMSLKE